jgi:hypothetical protein
MIAQDLVDLKGFELDLSKGKPVLYCPPVEESTG